MPFGYDFSTPVAHLEAFLIELRALLDQGVMPSGSSGRVGIPLRRDDLGPPKVWVGALASGTLAVGALSSAGGANATCVAAGGWFSIGSGCVATSPGDFALAIGKDAEATADGGGNTAISWGDGATTYAVGTNNTAIGRGLGANAEAYGVNNKAIAIGDAIGAGGGGTTPDRSLAASGRTTAIAGTPNVKFAADASEVKVDSNNTAIAVGGGARAVAARGSNNYASAFGDLSKANAGLGNDNRAIARGVQAEADALGGNHNTAIAIGNPVPVADDGTSTSALVAAPRR